ncbi:MAG TPA: hypothetical protein VHK67_04075 [Rhabdochlamydiaceae bacterium]|nr:hypothetical protein [Rhabdochlamydiaceae bacterium]
MKYDTSKVKRSVFLAMIVLSLGSSNLLLAERTTSDKIKGGIQTSADTLKKGVDKTKEIAENTKEGVKKGAKKFGEKVEDLQTYFRKKFHEQATVGHATVSDVTFNGHSMAAIVKPGERIEGQLKCTLDKEQLKNIKYHCLLIGFKGREKAETAVDIGRGIFVDQDSRAGFTLIAPSEPGFYKVRFKPMEGYIEHDMLNKWKDPNGTLPNSSSTIGLIYVRA